MVKTISLIWILMPADNDRTLSANAERATAACDSGATRPGRDSTGQSRAFCFWYDTTVPVI